MDSTSNTSKENRSEKSPSKSEMDEMESTNDQYTTKYLDSTSEDVTSDLESSSKESTISEKSTRSKKSTSTSVIKSTSITSSEESTSEESTITSTMGLDSTSSTSEEKTSTKSERHIEQLVEDFLTLDYKPCNVTKIRKSKKCEFNEDPIITTMKELMNIGKKQKEATRYLLKDDADQDASNGVRIHQAWEIHQHEMKLYQANVMELQLKVETLEKAMREEINLKEKIDNMRETKDTLEEYVDMKQTDAEYLSGFCKKYKVKGGVPALMEKVIDDIKAIYTFKQGDLNKEKKEEIIEEETNLPDEMFQECKKLKQLNEKIQKVQNLEKEILRQTNRDQKEKTVTLRRVALQFQQSKSYRNNIRRIYNRLRSIPAVEGFMGCLPDLVGEDDELIKTLRYLMKLHDMLDVAQVLI